MILILKDHNWNKAYNLLFLCNPYHQLSAIKDIISYSPVVYCWVYILETVCKVIDGKIYLNTYLLTHLLTCLFYLAYSRDVENIYIYCLLMLKHCTWE